MFGDAGCCHGSRRGGRWDNRGTRIRRPRRPGIDLVALAIRQARHYFEMTCWHSSLSLAPRFRISGGPCCTLYDPRWIGSSNGGRTGHANHEWSWLQCLSLGACNPGLSYKITCGPQRASNCSLLETPIGFIEVLARRPIQDLRSCLETHIYNPTPITQSLLTLAGKTSACRRHSRVLSTNSSSTSTRIELVPAFLFPVSKRQALSQDSKRARSERPRARDPRAAIHVEKGRGSKRKQVEKK